MKSILHTPLFFVLVCSWAISCNGQTHRHFERAAERNDLVDHFIIPLGVDDPKVIKAMRHVPRHRFVPENLSKLAYVDRALPIGAGQTISQPSLVALMTQLLQPDSTRKVLEIGTGSGYQAAILAELTDSVFTIEIIPSLAESAKKLLHGMGYRNILVKTGDGYLGWPRYAPFDAIIVTCAPEKIPEPLKAQLREGGRMVIPAGPENTVQELYLLRKINGRIRQTAVLPVRFVPMLDEDGKRH